MIKKYLQFIKEADEVETPETENKEVTPQSDNKYSELKEEVKSMIEKTIEKSGGEFKSFVDKFIKSPEDVKIEGFINDSDIYEFYLKFRNDIDELLNNVKYFDEVPSESNTFGLYDYIISGTERAVIEAVKTL
jgi:deoxyribodipyrimidine photolyase